MTRFGVGKMWKIILTGITSPGLVDLSAGDDWLAAFLSPVSADVLAKPENHFVHENSRFFFIEIFIIVS